MRNYFLRDFYQTSCEDNFDYDLISTCNLQTDINNNNSHSVSEALESLSESSSSFRGLQNPSSAIHIHPLNEELLSDNDSSASNTE